METKVKIVLDCFNLTQQADIALKLKSKHSNIEIKENGILSEEIKRYWEYWPKELKRDFDFYIVAEPDYSNNIFLF